MKTKNQRLRIFTITVLVVMIMVVFSMTGCGSRKIKVTGVSLTCASAIELNIGETFDFSGYTVISPADATDKSYALTSSAPESYR